MEETTKFGDQLTEHFHDHLLKYDHLLKVVAEDYAKKIDTELTKILNIDEHSLPYQDKIKTINRHKLNVHF